MVFTRMSSFKVSFCREDYSTWSIIDSYSEHRAQDPVIKLILLYHDLTATVMFKKSSAFLFTYRHNPIFFKGKFYNELLVLLRETLAMKFVFSLLKDSFIYQHRFLCKRFRAISL